MLWCILVILIGRFDVEASVPKPANRLPMKLLSFSLSHTLFLTLHLSFSHTHTASPQAPLGVNCTERVRGRLGSPVVLPCWLSPPLNAEDLEVRWYRPNHFSSPVLLYRGRKLLTEQQDESYGGRSSLATRHGLSPDLKGGDVSLKLEQLHQEDEGIFNCYVTGDSEYASSLLTLSLYAVGLTPVFSVQRLEDSVNVSCSSCGWLPEPSVQWTSGDGGVLEAGGVLYRKGAEGLHCVQTWLLVSPSQTHLASCSLSISPEDSRGAALDVQAIAHLMEGSNVPWYALFTVALLAVLAAGVIICLLYKKYRGYTEVKKDEEENLEEVPYKWSGINQANLDELRKYAENIILDTINIHPDLKVNAAGTSLRDAENIAQSNNSDFPYWLSVRGKTSFGSGCSYWEVRLKRVNVPVKMSWLIGVNQGERYQKSHDKSDCTPSKGFWFLYSDQNGIYTNTEPEILPLFTIRPESVGVFLDYDNGKLSFYDAKEGIHLITMKGKFQGNVYPLFNPGIGDKSPLEITDISSLDSKTPSQPPEDTNTQNDHSNQNTQCAENIA